MTLDFTLDGDGVVVFVIFHRFRHVLVHEAVQFDDFVRECIQTIKSLCGDMYSERVMEVMDGSGNDGKMTFVLLDGDARDTRPRHLSPLSFCFAIN